MNDDPYYDTMKRKISEEIAGSTEQNDKRTELIAALACADDDLLLDYSSDSSDNEAIIKTAAVIVLARNQAISKSLMEAPFFQRDDHCKLHGVFALIDEKSDTDFFDNFRLTRQTFCDVQGRICHSFDKLVGDARGRYANLNCSEALHMTLWYLGHRVTYRQVGQHFRVSRGCVHKHVERIIELINDLARDVIQWPEEITGSERDFRMIAQLPGVIGCIDNTRIHIRTPDERQSEYVDQHSHSVHLTVICNSKREFTYVDAGCPGSCTTTNVFLQSAFQHTISTRARTLFPTSYFHILGDNTYPLGMYLMVPYEGHLDPIQTNYNRRHSETRRVVRSALGMLKARFRRLIYIDADIDRISKLITAACVLHNIALRHSAEESYLTSLNDISAPELDRRPFCHLPKDGVASQKRDLLASLVNRDAN